ncbi:MAG: hypothetical protein Fur0024_1150 [Patescibacteria group bacterium]
MEDKIYEILENVEIDEMPKEAVFGISGEHIFGKTDSLIYERKKPNLSISYDEIADIVAMTEEKVKKDLLLKNFSQNFELVNSAVVFVNIDGYEIKNPIGFEGKILKAGVFNAFAPLVQLSAIQSVAERIGFRSFNILVNSYSLSQSINLPENFSGFIVDVGHNITSFAYIKSGILNEIKSFSIGGSFFSNENFEKESEDIWCSAFEIAIEEMIYKDVKRNFKPNFLLLGGGTLFSNFKKLIKNMYVFDQKINAKFLSISDVRGILLDKNCKLTEDLIPILASSATLNNFQE